MKIRWHRFNIYLLTALVVACGCQISGEKKPKKLLSTLRLHLEVSRNATKESEQVPIYREKPVWVNAEKKPFLSEEFVSSARVVDEVGGFVLRIQFDHQGATVLEQITTENRGRKIAIFSQFADQLKDYRWLAAPVISHRITDGVLVFTPDTTHEEAEEIALGLNNVSKKVHKWIDK